MASESSPISSRFPKNVIICIGDGMGFEAVKAAGYYASGETGTLSFEAFPHQAEIKTYAANTPMTDSGRCCHCYGDRTQGQQRCH